MTIAAILAVLVWLYLLFARGIFWQAGPVLPTAYPATTPSVAVVVPARDEAPLIEASLRSLLDTRLCRAVSGDPDGRQQHGRHR